MVVAISLVVAFKVHRGFSAFLLVGGGLQYLFMLTQPPHAWYWFPVVICLVIPFSGLDRKAAVLIGLLLLIIVAPFEATRNELSYKTLHLQELNAVAIQRTCINDKLRQYQPDTVFDMASIGTQVTRVPDAPWKTLNYHDSFVSLQLTPMPVTGTRHVLLLGERSRQRMEWLRERSQAPGAVIAECGSIKLIRIDT